MCHNIPTEADLEAAAEAPRVTNADLEDVISAEYYGRASELFSGVATDGVVYEPKELQTLTICLLVLYNGFIVVGTSACASPANFNEEIGQRLARADAKRKLWAFEGYALRDRLHAEAQMSLPA